MANEMIISKAKECFAAAEAKQDLVSILPHVNEGLALLDEFQEQHPRASGEEIETIRKIRRDFTQHLLVQFLSTQAFRQETWIDYFELFLLRLQKEMSDIATSEPFLKAQFDSNLSIWFAILRAHLENDR